MHVSNACHFTGIRCRVHELCKDTNMGLVVNNMLILTESISNDHNVKRFDSSHGDRKRCCQPSFYILVQVPVCSLVKLEKPEPIPPKC